MRLLIMVILLALMPINYLSATIKNLQTCAISEEKEITLLSLQTSDGDTPYLAFDNIITSAFLDGSVRTGELVLAQCVNHTLIFALSNGPPYLSGCLVTGVKESDAQKNVPQGFCFAERNAPEAVWFGKNHTLLIIRNVEGKGEWQGKYILYDSRKDEAWATDSLPNNAGYEIFPLNAR
ncbi:hypothetical protein [Pseudocitrobacter vendiensis]|uniref:Uncharacterized protein n=1 Tax=Pseudocitrobacter vendiensis TaxID=2488306 RepID=A0ABM9F5C4_9ENTR|nr:hypothetical protein FBBNIHIM_03900 [Pseudocitrobacter vendiensis]